MMTRVLIGFTVEKVSPPFLSRTLLAYVFVLFFIYLLYNNISPKRYVTALLKLYVKKFGSNYNQSGEYNCEMNFSRVNK